MAIITQTGAEFISEISPAIRNFPFGNYLTIGDLGNENWSTSTYDPDTAKQSVTWKSNAGSSIIYTSNDTGDDKSGSSKGSIAITGKLNGTKASRTWADEWSDSGGVESVTLNWTYTAGTATKNDDFSIKYSLTSKDASSSTSTGSKGNWTENESLDFSNINYSYKSTFSGVGNWVYDKSAGSNTVDKKTITMTYAYADKLNSASLNFSGKLTKDLVADQVSADFTNLKLLLSDYSITTTKWSAVLSIAAWDSLPDIGYETGIFETITTNLSSLGILVLDSNNTISISSTIGIEINAGAGNDTIAGGIGDDTIIAGVGIDQLTGGKGADLFVFVAGDSALSAKASDQIKDFKFSEGDQIKLDGLAEINCHVRDLKEASFSSAQVDANKDFSQGLNVSIQFVGSNALVFVDFNADGMADSVITLVGLKARNSAFVDYAESGEMFA